VNSESLFPILLISWIGFAPIIAIVLMRIAAPYGRHGNAAPGPRVPASLGWLLMELPALIVFPAIALASGAADSPVLMLLLGLWFLHYGNRALVYPWRIRSGSPMPLVIVLSGVVFNVINGSFLGYGLTAWNPPLELTGLSDPRPWLGTLVFLAGFALNLQSDSILRGLRKSGEKGYRIPHGGAYRWVSCPNYLGELLEWTGWAIASWSLPGLAFVIWTAANLAPRALTHHRWYRDTFPDYPRNRKALLPYIL
jgi:protein-S-isoprenylcysteine O-methyltransferase Ste14